MGDLVEDVDQLPHPNALEGSEPLVLVALEQPVQQLPGHGRDLGALHGAVVDPPQHEGGAGRGAAEPGKDEVGASREEE